MDPVGWLDRSLSDQDLELLSFLLQGISYGRVEQIRVSFEDLVRRFHLIGMGANGAGLHKWLSTSDLRSSATSGALKGWKHRLNVSKDIVDVLHTIKREFVDPGFTMASHFNHQPNLSFEDRVLRFCDLFEQSKTKSAAGTTWRGAGPSWFAPSPAKGGTSKRLMMWLRWMLRDDELDLGLWCRMINHQQLNFSRSDLFVPVDTHIFKFAREWRLVSHNSPTWQSVKLITEALRCADPKDPVRFDFSICHAGKIASRKSTGD
jgi:uncharacterized protein (TIGR02757 family)